MCTLDVNDTRTVPTAVHLHHSYPRPRAAAAGSNGTDKGQTRKFPMHEIASFLEYWIDMTRSQLNTNTGILVCLVREIWQFKFFTGKEVTPVHEQEACRPTQPADCWNYDRSCNHNLVINQSVSQSVIIHDLPVSIMMTCHYHHLW